MCSTPACSSRQWTSSINNLTTGWFEAKIIGCFSSFGNSDLWIHIPTRRKWPLGHITGFKLARLLSFTGPCCSLDVIYSGELASCTLEINHSSAFCISKPVKGLSILSSSFTLELLTNLLIQATVLYFVEPSDYTLLNLVKSINGSLGCTTQLTLALLFFSGSTISHEGFDLKSSGQSFSDSCNQMGPFYHKWLSLNWLADKPRLGRSAGFCGPG